MMDGYGHGWGMGWWWIIGLIVLIVVIWLVIKAVNQRGAGRTSEKSSLDILKDRYARGEIDEEEFEKRKKDLM